MYMVQNTYDGSILALMKLELRKRAETLRKGGWSIKHISRALGVSPGTVSRWCTQIYLSSSQRALLDARRREAGLTALKPWIERNRKKKLADIHAQTIKGRKDVGRITQRDLFMLGLGLYWGEGYKRGSQEWGFTNSDPALIQAIIVWLKDCYGIEINRLRARITVNKQYITHVARMTKDWSTITNIPQKNFSSPSIITGYGKLGKNMRTYRGTLRIKVMRGTSLRRRILASIAAVKL